MTSDSSRLTPAPSVPFGVDSTTANASRVYDYYLGGFHNFAADREMARQAIAMWPDLPLIMQANRAFLRRAVTHLIELGVRQFLDIGSGIPTVGSVHDTAQALDPLARVVYVDLDPVAVAHARALLAGNERAGVVLGDLRNPSGVLNDQVTTGLLDPGQPTALLMVAVLHFVGDSDDPAAAVAAFRDGLGAGSYLAVSHASDGMQPPALTESHRDLYRRTSTPMTMRGRDQVEAFFDGYELLAPGVVLIEEWAPGQVRQVENPQRFPAWAGIGRA
jgi:hypothetical protein